MRVLACFRQPQATAQGCRHPRAANLRRLQQHAHDLPVAQGRRQVCRQQAGIRHQLAVDGEGLGGGVQRSNGAAQLEGQRASLGFDARGHDAAVGRVEDAVHFHHGASGQGRQTTGQRAVEDGAGGDQHRLAQHNHGGRRGVDGAHGADDLAAPADAHRQRGGRSAIDIAAVHFHHHAELQVAVAAAVAVFIGDRRGAVIKAHTADEHRAKAGDGALAVGACRCGRGGRGRDGRGVATATAASNQNGCCSERDAGCQRSAPV